MGAAQNAALHLLLVDQLLQVLSKVIVNGGLSGGIAHVALHQVGQVGAAMADDLLIRRHLSDQIGVAVGGGGKAGGDHAHLMGGQLGHRVRASLDHAEHRTAHFIPVLVDEAGDGIAGHQQRLHAVVLHKAQHIAGHGEDLLRAVVAVRRIGPVAQIEQILMWHQLLHLPGHAEATDSGVDHADRTFFSYHGSILLSREHRSRFYVHHNMTPPKKVAPFCESSHLLLPLRTEAPAHRDQPGSARL